MIFFVMLAGFSLFTGLVVEVYKKQLRKDKSGVLENKLVALCLSFLFGFVSYKAVSVTGLPSVFVKSWALIPVFSVAIYLMQLPACMEIWKPVVKRWIGRL